MNVMAELTHRGGAIMDPWDFQDPAANPPAPCRSIPITDELRAKDAADRAALTARETHPDWAIKAELRQENLRLVRRPVGPGRVEPLPRVTLAPREIPAPKPHRPPKPPKPARTRPTCGQCQAKMAWKRTEPLCPKCARLAARPKRPDPAPQPAKLPAPVPVHRFCPCGHRLHRRNPGELCAACRGLSKSKEDRLARRVKCEREGCDHLLRWPRTSGICGPCNSSRANRAATTARYRAKRIAQEGSKCRECGHPIRWNSKSGLCAKHVAESRQCRTILHAPTLEEHKLNQLWGSLSLQDKYAVLEEVLE